MLALKLGRFVNIAVDMVKMFILSPFSYFCSSLFSVRDVSVSSIVCVVTVQSVYCTCYGSIFIGASSSLVQFDCL